MWASEKVLLHAVDWDFLVIQEIPEGGRKIKGRLLANGAEIIDTLCLSPLECKLCEDRDLAILFTFVAPGPNI